MRFPIKKGYQNNIEVDFKKNDTQTIPVKLGSNKEKEYAKNFHGQQGYAGGTREEKTDKI